MMSAMALLLCSGCSGINTTQSVSPATFFMPGLLKAAPAAPLPDHQAVPAAVPQDNLLAQAR
jgi:hypothetical protein